MWDHTVLLVIWHIRIDLPRKARTFLARLRSGYCTRLNSYKHWLNPAVPNSCSDCNVTPHSVVHLFKCPMHQTDLTPVDLWLQPKEVADFLNAWPEQDGGWATTTTMTNRLTHGKPCIYLCCVFSPFKNSLVWLFQKKVCKQLLMEQYTLLVF